MSSRNCFILTHSDLTASIQRGNWIGYRKDVASQCAYCPYNPDLSHTSYVTLPSRNNDLEAFFCDGLNRKGILCGQCKEGYGPVVNSDQYRCVKCFVIPGFFIYSVNIYQSH